MWINIAKSVAAFNVTKTVGPDGQVIVPVAETTDGMVIFVLDCANPLIQSPKAFCL
jgi:hypothetical protein